MSLRQTLLDVYKSSRWRDLRDKILAERSGKCEWCEKAKPKRYMHLHHKSYARLGAEEREDVELLCAMCHAIHHGRLPQKKKRNRRRLRKEKPAERRKPRASRRSSRPDLMNNVPPMPSWPPPKEPEQWT